MQFKIDDSFYDLVLQITLNSIFTLNLVVDFRSILQDDISEEDFS